MEWKTVCTTKGTKSTKKRKFGLSRTVQWVIPAWSAGIQIDMDVSGGILADLPAIHAGMTKICIFILCRRA